MKYIIDIPCELLIKDDGYSFSDGKSYCITGNLSKLTPYTNINIKERAEEFGRGYDAGWDEGSKFHEAEKESIEDEVWEFVRICLTMDGSDFVDAFDSCSYINLLEYSYQKAKEKYEAWMKQKNEICVGDEVKFDIGNNNDMKAIALDQTGLNCEWSVLTENGCVEEHDEEELHKTGKHFDDVDHMLKKMSEEE